jgi:hypothetical protein
MDLDKPQFKHYCCNDCKFLGRYVSPTGEKFDLYFCDQCGKGSGIDKSVIARNGDEGPDYSIGPYMPSPELDEAIKRAVDKGFMEPEVSPDQFPPVHDKIFTSEQEAEAWMDKDLEDSDEHCIDNYRFAFLDDAKAMADYQDKKDNGCCGYFDEEVVVNGRKAIIGCNYGH